MAHFLAQVTAGTDGFNVMLEDYHYRKEVLLKEYPHLFNTSNVDQYVNCLCVFDKMYCCRHGNGNEASKDGSKYRGRGIIQLTFKEEYQQFTTYYQNKFNDYSVNFVTNPELLETNMKYAVLSALWEAVILKKLNKEADRDNVFNYSKKINGINPKTKEPNGFSKRKNNLKKAKQTLCL